MASIAVTNKTSSSVTLYLSGLGGGWTAADGNRRCEWYWSKTNTSPSPMGYLGHTTATIYGVPSDGTGGYVNLTGLSAGTTYYCSCYVYNDSGALLTSLVSNFSTSVASYSVKIYMNDADIASVRVRSSNGNIDRTVTTTTTILGFTTNCTFTATTASGSTFTQWVYRLGDEDTGTQQTSASASFTYTGRQDIFIRAEGTSSGSGGDSGGTTQSWVMMHKSFNMSWFINNGPDYIDYSFTTNYRIMRIGYSASASGKVKFYSTGNLATKAYVCYADTVSTIDFKTGIPSPQNWIAENSGGYDGSNFKLEVDVEANTEYYLFLRTTTGVGTGTVNLWVEWIEEDNKPSQWTWVGVTQGATVKNVSYTHWNDFITRIGEWLTYKKWGTTVIGSTQYGYSGTTTYTVLLEGAKMTDTESGRTLTAKRFNIARYVIGSMSANGTGLSDFSLGDEVKASYFHTLADVMNTDIE